MALIISATNRPNSNTAKVAQHYQTQLAAKKFQSSILSLTDLPHNLMATDLYGQRSDTFAPIQALINQTEKFIFVIPEYNGSFPGVLKLLIDACDFPQSFYDKKAALVGLSSGKYGNIRGIDHFTGVCHYINLQVMSLKLHIPNIRTELNETGNFFKEDTLRFTNQQIDRFIEF